MKFTIYLQTIQNMFNIYICIQCGKEINSYKLYTSTTLIKNLKLKILGIKYPYKNICTKYCTVPPKSCATQQNHLTKNFQISKYKVMWKSFATNTRSERRSEIIRQ